MRTTPRYVWLRWLVISVAVTVGSSCSRPVTVEAVPHGSSKGSCGEYTWLVKLTLDKNSKGGGWIVQEIDYRSPYSSCDKATGGNDHMHFWEAGQVLSGQDHPAGRGIDT